MIVSPQFDGLERRFKQHHVSDVLFNVNRVCTLFYRTGSVDSHPDLIKTKDLKSAVLWAAAEAARLAIWWCYACGSPEEERTARPCTGKDLDELIYGSANVLSSDRLLGTKAAEAKISGASGTTLHDLIQRFFEPQYLIGRQSRYRTGQVTLMYHRAAHARAGRDPQFRLDLYQQALQTHLGCDVRGFALAADQIHGHSLSDNPRIGAEAVIPDDKPQYHRTRLYEHLDSGLRVPAAGMLMKLLSATPTEMQTWMRKQVVGDSPERFDPDRIVLEAPNPLLRYPLARPFRNRDDVQIAPIPHLVSEWLYEPLATYLHDCDDVEGKRQRLPAVFEEYIGMLAQMCSRRERLWIHENEIKPPGSGQKVVDWVSAFSEDVVLVDAKTAFIGLGQRYEGTEEGGRGWDSVFRQNWAKAVKQGTLWWDAVLRGDVARLQEHRHKSPILIIVTLTDNDRRAGMADVFQYVNRYIDGNLRPIPYTIMSLDRFERLMTTWEQRDDEWLPQILRKATRDGGNAIRNELGDGAGSTLERATMAEYDTLRAIAGEGAQESSSATGGR